MRGAGRNAKPTRRVRQFDEPGEVEFRIKAQSGQCECLAVGARNREFSWVQLFDALAGAVGDGNGRAVLDLTDSYNQGRSWFRARLQ